MITIVTVETNEGHDDQLIATFVVIIHRVVASSIPSFYYVTTFHNKGILYVRPGIYRYVGVVNGRERSENEGYIDVCLDGPVETSIIRVYSSF
jgi:hypothetical protein